MNLDDLMLNVRASSFGDAVCLTDIQTEGDKQKYGEMGYWVSLTESEFKAMFPDIPAENIYYIPTLSGPAFYFNDRTMAAVPFHAEFYTGDMVKPEMIEGFKRAVAEMEQQAAKKDFRGSVLTLQDAMRLEYLEKLIAKGDDIPGLYGFFMNIYRISDYGFERVKPEVLDTVCRAKTDADRERIEKALRKQPDTMTIYRGGSIDRSTPADKGYSWSLDINAANFFACRRGQQGGYIAIGKVQKDKVIDIFPDGREQEVIVNPKDVEIVETIDILGLPFCEKVLPEISDIYKKFREQIEHTIFMQNSEVHGREHEARVLLLCLTLGHMLKLPQSDMKALATAAVHHDTQRNNDGEDAEHGLWARRAYEMGNRRADPIVSFLCEYHSLPDEEGFKAIRETRALSKNRARVEQLYRVFKDADALDRVRFGIQNLDMSFLRLPESKRLTLVARLYLEQIKLD